MRIHTIGHSTRPLEELIALLEAAPVQRLVDVRSLPRSRRNPQFDAGHLHGALASAGIDYQHLKALGGRRPAQAGGGPSPNALWREAAFRNYADYALTPGFRRGLDLLLRLARERGSAIMCAEAHWAQCHRRIITDYLLAAGVEVEHILGPNAAEPARLTPGAQAQPDGTLHYPAPQGELFG
jgi:uncharacterized protein (DUF488 family)